MPEVYKSKSGKILTVVLLAQAALFYGFSRGEHPPVNKPLGNFELPANPWVMRQNQELDKETLDVLKADDILSRIYQNSATSDYANLFVAYFRTQRTGKTPHSPKNCLPGTGWTPSDASTIAIDVPGSTTPIEVNRYIVSRGQNQSVVLYWYQSNKRVTASEYAAKIYTVADAIRFNRTDTALVRVVVAVPNGDTARATETAKGFVQKFYQPLKTYLPS